MAIKLDKVVKGILEERSARGADPTDAGRAGAPRPPSPVDNLKRWAKAFALPDKKKERARYDNTWARLHTVSAAIDRLWQGAADDIKALDERTRDDVAYFGHEPKPGAYQDIKSKDRQLHTEISRDEYGNVDYSKALDSVTDYFRLKTILDLWCALWFWPLDRADALPTWDDFEAVVKLLARNEFEAPNQMKFDFLGDVKMTADSDRLAEQFRSDPTLENLYKLFPFAKISQQVAERQHFLHWELEFAPVFKARGGFDLIVGNPPWVKLQWNEQGILSEYDPHIAVRKISASDTMALRADAFARHAGARAAYLREYAETTGTKAFLGAACNYPTLAGVQTNLFKFFLPLAFRLGNASGVASFIHPEGVYDDPNGGLLRATMYPRLRLHAQFINELKLFDIHHCVMYSLNVYGPEREAVAFRNVSRLYHPSTLEDSLRMVPAAADAESAKVAKARKDESGALRSSADSATFASAPAGMDRGGNMPAAADAESAKVAKVHRECSETLGASTHKDGDETLRTSADFATFASAPAGKTSEAPLPLERNEQGTWNLVGHPDRVVNVNDDTLTLFATLYDDAGTPPRQARLPAIYTNRFLHPILTIFANSPNKMWQTKYGVSVCWDETGSQRKGFILRKTGRADLADEVIYSGPQFFVGNPMNKTARPVCRLNSDYDNIDLTVMPEDYRPRTNYVRNVPRHEYDSHIPVYNGKLITDCYRVFCRRMISCSSERTLIAMFAPKGWAHVNTVIEYIFDDSVDMSQLTSTFGAWMSLPFDWFVKSTGKCDFFNETARLLPALPKNPRIAVRALLLNCLNRDYGELWREAWDEAYLRDGWLSSDPHLTPWRDHLKNEWTWNTPLRTQLDRRQALVELDVIVTKALGLSLDDLLLMYRVSFPTMRKYDADTFYDQNGRCVFSAKGGESYLSRKEWEEIKDMPSGEFKKTITETVFSDTPTERTIVYQAPFFRKCREDDYREAWAALEGKV